MLRYLFLVIVSVTTYSCHAISRGNDRRISALETKLEHAKGCDHNCTRLEIEFIHDQVLYANKHGEYCDCECGFASLQCGAAGSGSFGSFNATLFDEMSYEWYEWAKDQREKRPLEIEIGSSTVETIFQILHRLVPLLFSIPPIVLNRWQKDHTGVLVIYGLSVVSLMLWCGVGAWTIWYIIYVVYACISLSSSSPALGEIVVATMLMSFSLCALVMTDDIIQLCTMLLMMFFYFLWLYKAFSNSKRNNALISATYFLQLFVLREQFMFVVSTYQVRTLSVHVLMMLLGSIFPRCDDGNSYFIWAIIRAGALSEKLETIVSHVFGGPIFFTLLQFFLFFTFRTFYGLYTMRSLKIELDSGAYFEGLYIYAVDLFGGISTAYRLAFKYEKFSNRRILYAFTNICMLYYEFYGAFEFVLCRCTLTLLDYMFFDARYSTMPRYLGGRISLKDVKCFAPSSFLQSSFPQRGSLPWVNVDDILSYADYVKNISVMNAEGRWFSGEGLVARVSDRIKLLSVHHMIPTMCSITMDNNNIRNVTSKSLGGGTDPVVIVDVGHVSDFEEYARAPEFKVLVKDDVNEVSNLIFFIKDENREVYANVSDNFRIDKRDGSLVAAVNLRKGDSGGPVIAVLNDGTMRYAGAVSRGSSNTGAGNFISWTIQTDPSGNVSSDDEDVNKHLRSEGRVQKFNANRSGQNHSQYVNIRNNALKQLRSYCQENEVVLTNVTKVGVELKVSDFDNDKSFAEMRAEVGDLIALDSRRHDDVSPEEDGGVRSKKKRSKSSHKDASVRKRRLSIVDDGERLDNRARKDTLYALYTVRSKLECCYLKEDARGIFGLILKGQLPNYGRYCHVSYSPEYDDYIYNEDYPDEDDLTFGRIN